MGQRCEPRATNVRTRQKKNCAGVFELSVVVDWKSEGPHAFAALHDLGQVSACDAHHVRSGRRLHVVLTLAECRAQSG